MYRFSHERLHAYQVALEAARAIRAMSWPRGEGPLGDQARRASSSVVLNIAEGKMLTGKAQLHHFRIAIGSAAEACAVLDLVVQPGGEAVQEKLRRVAAMLESLSRSG